MVETVASFRHRYVIELNDNDPIENALDECVMQENNLEFIEFSQKYLGSHEYSHRVIDEQEFIRIFDEDNDYLKDFGIERKLEFINKIEEVK